MSTANVSLLSTLVTAAQQNHQLLATLSEVDSIARTGVNAQLADATANRLHVARVAHRQQRIRAWIRDAP